MTRDASRLRAVTSSPAARGASLALAAMLALNLFVLGDAPEVQGLFPEPWDKLAHFAYFGTIAGLLAIATGGGWLWAVGIAALAVGVADEVHQATIPGRDASLGDLAADLAGITTAVLIARRALRRGPSQRGGRPAPS